MKAFHLLREGREKFTKLPQKNFEAHFGTNNGIRYGSGIVVVVDVSSSSASFSTTSDRNYFVLDNRAFLTLVRHAADDRENDGGTDGRADGRGLSLLSSSLSSSDGFLP